jgi:hypothetical protein
LVANWSPDLTLSPVPEWLSTAVDAALSDLQQPIAIDVRLGFEPASGLLWVSEPGERGRAGFQPHEEDGVYLLVAFADWLQEQFFLESRGARGQARPACPGHPHPAHAHEIDGEAWWVCPVDGHQVAMIGRCGR